MQKSFIDAFASRDAACAVPYEQPMDTPPSPEPVRPIAHQRARGALTLAYKRRDDKTVLDTLRQEGCLKVRFPRTDQNEWPGAITLNTAGGVAGGDQLRTTIIAGSRTAATVATQAAERFYRALPGTRADTATHLTVADHAALEWLPQETIFFDRCAVRRHLEIDLAPTAWFLGVESLVFGRTAMNEEVCSATIHDRITVRRDGRLILFDTIRLEGQVAALLDRPAIGRGARAIATILFAAPQAHGLLDTIREALAPYEAGASVLHETQGNPQTGLLVARIAAPTGAVLRRAVITGLNILRAGRTLPRVWLC